VSNECFEHRDDVRSHQGQAALIQFASDIPPTLMLALLRYKAFFKIFTSYVPDVVLFINDVIVFASFYKLALCSLVFQLGFLVFFEILQLFLQRVSSQLSFKFAVIIQFPIQFSRD